MTVSGVLGSHVVPMQINPEHPEYESIYYRGPERTERARTNRVWHSVRGVPRHTVFVKNLRPD